MVVYGSFFPSPKESKNMEAIAKKIREKLLRTIIIDDEEHQRKSLERLIQLYFPELKVVCLAEGVKSGLEAIKQHKPDLVFLDVRMTDGLGFDLLDQLKPVDPDELMQAVEKTGVELGK